MHTNSHIYMKYSRSCQTVSSPDSHHGSLYWDFQSTDLTTLQCHFASSQALTRFRQPGLHKSCMLSLLLICFLPPGYFLVYFRYEWSVQYPQISTSRGRRSPLGSIVKAVCLLGVAVSVAWGSSCWKNPLGCVLEVICAERRLLSVHSPKTRFVSLWASFFWHCIAFLCMRMLVTVPLASSVFCFSH